jgi:hypothetical protein
MAVKRWMPSRFQTVDSDGDPYTGARLFFYAAGSSTKQNTYTDETGNTANDNPIVLGSDGRPAVEIWLTVGESYKVGLAAPGSDDPPGSFVWTEDDVEGINDASITLDQWISGPAPTYISSTSFSLVGDQTTTFTVGRRVKVTDAGGTKYCTIKTSAYTSLTTIVLDAQDSDALASPTSAVSYGIIDPENTSHPVMSDAIAIAGGSSDRSKRLRWELDGITTATTRVGTPPNYDFRVMSQTKGADVASATTTNLDTATGDLVDVTGTTTITAITLSEGREATVRFTGALVLTNGASLILPGAANITTVAGDVAVFRGYASSVVRCVSYTPITIPPTRPIINTPVAVTSGTSVALATGIPSWVKRVSLLFSSVSSNGTSEYLIQLGDSGGLETTGYVSEGGIYTSAAAAVSSSTAGFIIRHTSASAAVIGKISIDLTGTANTWLASGTFRALTTSVGQTDGIKTLSDTLTQISITTVNGTDAFDGSGTVTVVYE